MAALAWIACYIAVGVGLARFWLWRADRKGRTYDRDKDREDIQVEMFFCFLFWPLAVPIYLVVQGVKFAVYPRRLR